MVKQPLADGSWEEPTMFELPELTADVLTQAGIDDPVVQAAILEADERGDDEAVARLVWNATPKLEQRILALGAAFCATVLKAGPQRAGEMFGALCNEEQRKLTLEGASMFEAAAQDGAPIRDMIETTLRHGWDVLDEEFGFSERGLPNPWNLTVEQRLEVKQQLEARIATLQEAPAES